MYMGNQYRVTHDRVNRWDDNTIPCKTFNAVSRAPTGHYEQNIKDMDVGDVIIEVVGVVRERPKTTQQVVPFKLGEMRYATNGTKWKLIGILSDRLVWTLPKDSGPSLFTKIDGKSWVSGYTGFDPKIEEVVVGTEKYLDKE